MANSITTGTNPLNTINRIIVIRIVSCFLRLKYASMPVCQYADDTTIICKHSDANEVMIQYDEAIDRIELWFAAH